MPVSQGLVQQNECPNKVRLNEIRGAVYGAVHVRLRGEMKDGVRLMQGQQRSDGRAVADVSPFEVMAWVVKCAVQRLKIPRVCERIEGHDFVAIIGNEPADYCRPDEASATGHEESHVNRIDCTSSDRISANERLTRTIPSPRTANQRRVQPSQLPTNRYSGCLASVRSHNAINLAARQLQLSMAPPATRTQRHPQGAAQIPQIRRVIRPYHVAHHSHDSPREDIVRKRQSPGSDAKGAPYLDRGAHMSQFDVKTA